MIIYLISYCLCFMLARVGWFIPSGLVLIAGAFFLYWKDYRASGNLIHLRGLFCLFFAGGQGISCMKLSRLQGQWSLMTWACFLAAVLCFSGAFQGVSQWLGPVRGHHWLKKQARGGGDILPEGKARALRLYRRPLFFSMGAVTAVSLGAFLIEAAVLGYIPFFLRGVPHAYSYFHISGLHYFTVSCVLEPSLYVLYLLAGGERSRWKKAMAAGFTVICLFIPILCVSRFQLIFAVGMAVFTFIAVNHRIRIYQAAVLVCLMIPLYVVLTIARSHDVAYLNGIFEMKNSGMPIFITQPYMYIANNYDNFNCLVEELPRHSMGLRMLFPLWALTGLKFLVPQLVNFPIYVDKEELTTLTLIYDAYYDFGILGVALFCCILGGICALLVWELSQMRNPVGYMIYAQAAMYMTLSFFTTWFSNPATWFYLGVTVIIYLFCRYRQGL